MAKAAVNIHEAKTHLSRLVERAEGGEEIVIARAGKPAAKLIPFTDERVERVPGRLRGQIAIRGDFDELPANLAAAFRGERP
jgi:prevent-host-death family protein